MAILISSIVGGVTCIGWSVCAASISGGFNGAGLLKSSSKRSTHLFLCSWVSVIGLPSLSLTGFSDLLYLPASNSRSVWSIFPFVNGVQQRLSCI
ncbi:unnamed protein product [Schistosoma intercalatum]|nr:unnamed protein product [Schistosoma intercalatum]